MRRRLFTLCSALSLLLCVAACALWAASQSRTPTVIVWGAGWRVSAQGCASRVVLLLDTSLDGQSHRQPGYDSRLDGVRTDPFNYGIGERPSPRPAIAAGGFGDGRERRQYLVLHDAALLAACAAAAAFAAGRALRCRRRAGRGLCPRCGYDLRATPERCPECGTLLGATV